MNWHLSHLGSAVRFCCCVLLSVGGFVATSAILEKKNCVGGFAFGWCLVFGGDFVTAYWTLMSCTSSLLRPISG